MYKNVKAGKYKNDEEAMADLYGQKEDYFKYRMLKSRLKQKLYNHLYFIEDNSIPKKEEKKCSDLIHQGKVLLLLGEYTLSAQQYKKAFKIAKQYEFTDVMLDCLSNLNFITTQLADDDNYYNTLGRLKHYKKIKSYEDEAYGIYYTNKLELLKSVKVKKSRLKNLPIDILKLKKIWKKSNSYNVFYSFFMLHSIYLDLSGNYRGTIQQIQKWENLLKLGKVNSYRFNDLLLKYSMINACLRGKWYRKGLKLAPKYLSFFDPFSRNWFAFMENYFLLAMHSCSYGLAHELISKVDENPYYHRLREKAKENWNLYKAYLFLIYPKDQLSKSFNFQEFLTRVPESGKDKLGHNVSILILQFVYLIKEKGFEQLYIKEDSFRKYASTYLKDPHTMRSYYFFKMLVVTIRTDFDPKKCTTKAAPLLEKLRASPEPGDAYAAIEIIPYEKLWEIILEYMEEKRTPSLSHSILQ